MRADQFASLEAELRALSPRVRYPSIPDLASAVGERIRSERVGSRSPSGGARPIRRRTGPAWWPRGLAPIALAVVAVLAVVLAASPVARAAVLSVFRKVPGIRVVVGAPEKARSSTAVQGPAPVVTPTATPLPAPAPAPAPAPSLSPSPSTSPPPTFLGTPTSLAAAQVAVPFAVAIPSAFGPPARVFLDRRVGRGMVTMQWPVGPGLPDAGGGIGAVLTQFDSGTNPDFPYFLKELMGTDATFTEVTINGGSGGWIEGGHPVEFAVPRQDDVRQVVSSRLAASTLLWLHNGVTMRFESDLSKAAAIDIANSVR